MSFWATRTIYRSANLVISPKPMRTKRARRLPIPQHEFGFTADTFRLFSETGLDGDRLARERDEKEKARRTAEAAQAALFTGTMPDGD
jgi:hypothetical protein